MANRDDAARSTALSILCSFDLDKSSLSPLFDNATANLNPQDRRFVRQLVNGVLKWRKRIDWTVNHFTKKPFHSLPNDVSNAIRLGLYQLLWLDRVPPRAAVHTTVDLVKKRGKLKLAGVVNAVLRRASTEATALKLPDRLIDPVGFLSLAHSHPEWMVQRWLERWGNEATEKLLESNNRPPKLFVRFDEKFVSAAGIPKEFSATIEPPSEKDNVLAPCLEGSFVANNTDGLFSSSAFVDGLFWVQDVNAGIPAMLLGAKPNERILDACCAPGGKTVQIAMAMDRCGQIVAADSSPARLDMLRATCQRMQLDCVEILSHDARVPAFRLGFDLAPFDRVLVDVPCSSTGAFARLPEARWRRRPSDLISYTSRQLDILKASYKALKPGGILVYSTCSLEPEENEHVVDTFLSQTMCATLEPACHFLSAKWANNYVQTLPGRDVGDGSFAARIRKNLT